MLNLVEAREERDRDEDDNGFLAVANLELWVKGGWISFVDYEVQKLGCVDCIWRVGQARWSAYAVALVGYVAM